MAIVAVEPNLLQPGQAVAKRLRDTILQKKVDAGQDIVDEIEKLIGEEVLSAIAARALHGQSSYLAMQRASQKDSGSRFGLLALAGIAFRMPWRDVQVFAQDRCLSCPPAPAP